MSHELFAAALAIVATTAGPVESTNPVADPAAVVVSGNARFTLLSDRMIRLEWTPDGKFEDRPSIAIIHRRTDPPVFNKKSESGWLTLTTKFLQLRYKEGSGKFAADNLSIEVTHPAWKARWTPGTPDKDNLLGTTRTLDSISGACPLEPGLLSRAGWSLIDDSSRPLLEPGAWPFPAPRRDDGAIDWYFLGYGRDYAAALQQMTRVAGRVPLPPKFVFGAWWSRYWAYSEAELRELVGEFQKNDVPLDVLVIDMDWHLDRWTGYTWNPTYFPDPVGFLKWVHEQGLRATLNLHPADGVGKHERAYADFARAMGKDPAKGETIPFDCTDPHYVKNYFELLHRPLEHDGIDFWWMDWQQGTQTKVRNLDPLFWLNHLHIDEFARDPAKQGRRPIMFTRWGGLGNHRYQIGFSGDTYCNWPSLAFQPYFTATAANVLYGYWSHDIGGHQPGPVDPELYARWIQWGALSPALRTHTTKGPLAERRIWKFPEPVFATARAAYQFRYALIPYLYNAARQCHDTGVAICRPLYYHWSESPEAYARTDEYMLGDQLLVRPVAAPMDADLGGTPVNVWIPPGEWTNWYTGRTYQGPCEANLLVPLDEVPLFVRAGGIISMAEPARTTRAMSNELRILHVFPGNEGNAELYDDDGESTGYLEDKFARTTVTYRFETGKHRIAIGGAQGEFPGMPAKRRYEVRLHDVWPAKDVRLGEQVLIAPTGSDKPAAWYDAERFCMVITTGPLPIGQPVTVTIAEETPDRAPLAAGLRGQVRLYRQMHAALGDHFPKSLPDPQQLVARLVDPATRAATAKLLTDLPALFESLVATQADPQTLRPLIGRLLGLHREVAVRPLAGRDDAVELVMRVGAHPPMGSAADLALRTELDSVDGAPQVSFEDPADKSIEMKREIPLTGGVRTRRLTGNVRVLSGPRRFKWPFERVLFPSINAWHVVGPFSVPFAKALATPFPPETNPDLQAKYPGADGEVTWRRVERTFTPGDDPNAEFRVNFHSLFGKGQLDAVAYAQARLRAPKAMKCVLAIGSDDGNVVWLNGREVFRNDVGRAYAPRLDRVPIELKEGVNTLMVKISQGGGDWSFSAIIEDDAGRPLPEVTLE